MRKLGTILRRLLTTLSVLLFVAMLVVWVRSFWHWDVVRLVRDSFQTSEKQEVVFLLGWSKGDLILMQQRNYSAISSQMKNKPLAWLGAPSYSATYLDVPLSEHPKELGAVLRSYAHRSERLGVIAASEDSQRGNVVALFSQEEFPDAHQLKWGLLIPCWMIVCPLGVHLLILAVRRMRRGWRTTRQSAASTAWSARHVARRVARAGLRLVTAMSLMLSVATAMAWMRGLYSWDTLVLAKAVPEGSGAVRRDVQFEWCQGELGLLVATIRRTKPDPDDEVPRPRWEILTDSEPPKRNISQSWFNSAQRYNGAWTWKHFAVTMTSHLEIDPSSRRSTFNIALPCWMAAILFSVLPAFRGRTWLLQRRFMRRQTQGYCRNCGYDLRATPERCPECGLILKTV